MTDQNVDVTYLNDWVHEFARLINENAQLLSDLDAAVGDADHGVNMNRGMTAVVTALDDALFLRMATPLKADAVDAATFAAALRAGVDGVVQRGRAEAGDKTMFDALAPALDALDRALNAGTALPPALGEAAAAAEKGRDATESMIAKKGRASYLGQRSVGHQDPGATSAAMLIQAAATVAGGRP